MGRRGGERQVSRTATLALMDRWVDPVLVFLAACSVPLLIIEGGSPTPDDARLVIRASWLIWGAFTANLVVRLVLAPDRRAELRNVGVDLIVVAGLPLYTIGDRTADAGLLFLLLIAIAGRGIRRGRLLRRTGHKLRTQPLRIVAFVVPFIWLTSAALVYRLEVDTGTVGSYGDGLWWSAVTLATVGYGDISPKSEAARAVAVVTMITGIGMFSVVTAKLAELLFVQRAHSSRHDVLQHDHTLVLGWSPKVFTIVSELVAANASRTDAAIVVMAERDHNDMHDAISRRVPSLVGSTTTLVTRSGSPGDPRAIAGCRPDLARSIIVIDDTDQDAAVVRAVLALIHGDVPLPDIPVVAEVNDPATARALSLALDGRITTVNPSTFIARTMAQACRSPGVARAYEALLDVWGSEIYVRPVEGAAGRRVGDLLTVFPRCCLIGVRDGAGVVDLNPPMDRVVAADDHLVLVATDDSDIELGSGPLADGGTGPAGGTGAAEPLAPEEPTRVVVFGWNPLAPEIVRELDAFLPAGSHLTVAVDPAVVGVPAVEPPPGLTHTAVTVRTAEGSSFAELVEVLAEEESDHAIVLCAHGSLSVAEADARALVTTMQVRRALDLGQRETSVVTELLDPADVALAPPEALGEFVVSEHLVSLLLTQLSEDIELAGVFDDLLDAEGAELYAKPASAYTTPGTATTFGDLVAAAGRRGECAIGYRVAALAHDAGQRFGVVVNPPKADAVTLGPLDRVLVVAEDGS